MNDEILRTALLRIFDELIDGPESGAAFVLNPGDTGVLRSLGKLTGVQASAVPVSGGASVAAHVDHLRYGFELLNRWAAGEQPFADADYNASWSRGEVSDGEWRIRLDELRSEASRWREQLKSRQAASEIEAAGAVSSVVHLAYHVGAIRQISRSARGPQAND